MPPGPLSPGFVLSQISKKLQAWLLKNTNTVLFVCNLSLISNAGKWNTLCLFASFRLTKMQWLYTGEVKKLQCSHLVERERRREYCLIRTTIPVTLYYSGTFDSWYFSLSEKLLKCQCGIREMKWAALRVGWVSPASSVLWGAAMAPSEAWKTCLKVSQVKTRNKWFKVRFLVC